MILSATSYVIPGTYHENVAYLAAFKEIEAVELLFYLYDEESRALFIREKPFIAGYSGRFSFSVHLPDPLLPRHVELVESTQDLAERYIIHPPENIEDGTAGRAFGALVNGWRARFGERFLLENLNDRTFGPALERLEGIPICFDVGHTLVNSGDIRGFLGTYGPRIREIHLHGVRDGQDHRAFGPGEPWLRVLLPFVRDFSGVLHLEVFSTEDLREIIASLEQLGVPPDRRSGEGES